MHKVPLIFDKAMQEARRYWCERLDAMSFEGHIALDRPRPRDGQRRISSFEHKLDDQVNALLQRVTANNAFLRYSGLVLGLKICCSKYSGQPDVTIFCPAEPQPGTTNLLPVASVIDPGVSFKTALIATKELLVSAYRRQHYPFSRMLFDIPDRRRPKYLPMIAALEEFNGRQPEGESDVAFLFQTNDNTTSATVRFDSCLYDEATLQQFFRSFNAILGLGLGDMNLSLADLSPDGACASVAGPADCSRQVGEIVSVHARIESRAAASPDSLAVVEGARNTSYRLLNEQARLLADAIAAQDVDLRKPIAILLDASTEFIIAMCAVLKTGGAFAPVRPLSATQSIAEILNELGCECIVCRSEHVPYLRQAETGLRRAIVVGTAESASEYNFVPLELNGCASPSQPDFPGVQGSAFAPACVLLNYREDTPSALSIQHSELLALFDWINESFSIGAADRHLLTPSLGLCEQLYDTLGTLTAGGTVEILEQSGAWNASQLATLLLSEAVTVWDVPTALVENMLGQIVDLCSRAERPKGPRVILLTGEKQSSILSGRLRQLFPAARIVGLYAAPAVQLWTTVFPVGDGVAARGDAAIAQAIRIYPHRVLNRKKEPVPTLVKGELHVERLPAGQETPATIPTGLRVQRLDSTRMRWLRGEDHCFTKYGCGVELTDVEVALCRHDYIRGAEVLALDGGPKTGQQVVAFVVADTGVLSAEAARDFLVLTGGVDVVPDRFVVLEEFPLLADGSIDRKVLIQRFVFLEEHAGDMQRVMASDIPSRLKTIWLDVLQAGDVADEDSFFTRGGNSLKATLLIARIRSEFNVELSVQNFFRKPTLLAIAELIAAEPANGASAPESEFQVVSREKYRVQLSGWTAEKQPGVS